MSNSLGITSPAGKAVYDLLDQALNKPGENTYGQITLNDQHYQIQRKETQCPSTCACGDSHANFVAPRMASAKFGFSLRKIRAFLSERWSVRKLQNDVAIEAELNMFGITPVDLTSTKGLPDGRFTLGEQMGATNLDLVHAKDKGFVKTKKVLDEVKQVVASTCKKLGYARGRFRVRCPVTGEKLTKENAVKVSFPNSRNPNSMLPVLMSRQGIMNALLQDDDTVEISRELLLIAKFSAVTDADIDESVNRSVFYRAWKALLVW